MVGLSVANNTLIGVACLVVIILGIILIVRHLR